MKGLCSILSVAATDSHCKISKISLLLGYGTCIIPCRSVRCLAVLYLGPTMGIIPAKVAQLLATNGSRSLCPDIKFQQ